MRRFCLPLRVQSVLIEVNAAPSLGLPRRCVNNTVNTATFYTVSRLLRYISLPSKHLLSVGVVHHVHSDSETFPDITFHLFSNEDVHNSGEVGWVVVQVEEPTVRGRCCCEVLETCAEKLLTFSARGHVFCVLVCFVPRTRAHLLHPSLSHHIHISKVPKLSTHWFMFLYVHHFILHILIY